MFVLNRSGWGSVYFSVGEVVFAFDEVKPLLHPLGVKRVVPVVLALGVLM